jgi:hypothetical protein
MRRCRSLSVTVALVLSMASLTRAAFVAPAGAGQGPPGNCETSEGIDASSDFCSYFQADQGSPGDKPTFWMQCPATAFQNGTDVFADHVDPIVYVFNLGTDATVPVTPKGHLNNGEGGYYNPGAGATAWYNELTVPVLPGYPAVLNGWGYCVLANDEESTGLVEDVPMSYFWVTPPETEGFVFPPDQYFQLSWAALFGSVRLLGDQAFRGPTLDLRIGGPLVTTTTTPQPSPPPPPPATTTTTRPIPTTTTSTTRAGGRG